MTQSGENTVTGAPQGGLDWDALEARVAGAGIPGYRRAWFVSLIRQGREAEAADRSALASHCFTRTETELKGFPADTSSTSATSATGIASTGSSSHPQVPPASPSAPRNSPLADLAMRRGGANRARYLEMLLKHAARLSPAERESYRAALEGSDAAPVSDLRRRLVDRLLRAARYQRQCGRLAAWARRRPASASEDRPAGPYNDYKAVAEMLRRLADLQPEWTAEFLEVYGDMRAVRLAYGEFLPGSTK